MLKLLIVDDERLDREGLAEQLEWEEYGISEVRLAKSGFEAIEVVKQLIPDILITDIKMPGMTGIQLAEKLKESIPGVKLIFVSGHDDFEYVRSAVRLNAYEYILKPVETEDLTAAVIKVTEEIERERKLEEEKKSLLSRVIESRPLMSKKLLNDLIYGMGDYEQIWSRIQDLGINMLEGSYTVLLVEVDDFKLLQGSMPECEWDAKISLLNEYVQGVQNPDGYVEVLQLKEQTHALILSFGANRRSGEISAISAEIAEKVIESTAKNIELSVTVGIGGIKEKISELYRSYDESCSALAKKFYEGKGKVYHNDSESQMQPVNPGLESIGPELSKCLLNCDLSKAIHLIDFLFDNLEASRAYDWKYIQNYCINLISRVQITLSDMNGDIDAVFGSGSILLDKLLKFETILDIRQWMKNVFKAVVEYLEAKAAAKCTRIIDEVYAYVEKHYDKEITLKEIAERLFYSPNHLGIIFKQETGRGFGQYLMEYRIKKASEKLKDFRLKIYEVAEMVGYKNMPSFVKQFKAVFEMTPTEYRERLK